MTTRSVPAGKALSACHTMAGPRPEISRSARAMSRSRLMPGKTTTADFIATDMLSFSADFDAVILDRGIGEELLSGAFKGRFGAGAVAALDLDIEDLALAHAGDPADPERAQRAFNGFALRIENAGLERDGDAGLHGSFNRYESAPPQHRGRPPAIWGRSAGRGKGRRGRRGQRSQP